MPREKPAYRDNLERLDKRFPDKELLTQKEVAEFTGLCRQSVSKIFPFKRFGISKATLARELS